VAALERANQTFGGRHCKKDIEWRGSKTAQRGLFATDKHRAPCAFARGARPGEQASAHLRLPAGRAPRGSLNGGRGRRVPGAHGNSGSSTPNLRKSPLYCLAELSQSTRPSSNTLSGPAVSAPSTAGSGMLSEVELATSPRI